MWFNKKEVAPPKKMKRVRVYLEDMKLGEIYFPFENMDYKDCGMLIKIDGEYVTLSPIIQDVLHLPIHIDDMYKMSKHDGWPMYKEVEDL